ncbi:MAG: tetratricopeptide repeat protein [Chitinophagaceae bacterium]|nr:tetratricopeptide repeat protein [Chitinophagaceae bacterium]
MKGILLFIAATITVYMCHAQVNSFINKGNEAYRLQQYDKAADAYREALRADPNNTTAAFNLGNALFKNKQFDEAAKQFDEMSRNTADKSLQSQSYYNKGVSLTQQKKLEESIDAYKQSLRLNPADSFARENLQRALNEKQQQQQQEQQQEQKKQQNKENNPPPKQNKLNQQQVQQLLKALEEQEKKLQERVMKKAPVPGQPDKDW